MAARDIFDFVIVGADSAGRVPAGGRSADRRDRVLVHCGCDRSMAISAVLTGDARGCA